MLAKYLGCVSHLKVYRSVSERLTDCVHVSWSAGTRCWALTPATTSTRSTPPTCRPSGSPTPTTTSTASAVLTLLSCAGGSPSCGYCCRYCYFCCCTCCDYCGCAPGSDVLSHKWGSHDQPMSNWLSALIPCTTTVSDASGKHYREPVVCV